MVKALILRSRSICWLLSVGWELIELATKYFIPNFAECWWDSLLLDVLICNGGGIELGLWLAHKFEMRDYDWARAYTIKGIWGKLKRFALQFTPFELEPIFWEPLSSFKQWVYVHLLILFVSLMELNAFLLKLFLWIPTDHSINLYRLILISLISIPSSRQYYLFVTDPKCKKLGSQCWVCVLIVLLELVLCIKTSPPIPDCPNYNKMLWGISLFGYLYFAFIMLRSYAHVKVE